MKNLTERPLKEDALRRFDFKKHLIVYIVVIAFLWVIWAVTGSGYIWPIWPMAGWGLGIILHYVSVYKP